MKKIRLTQGKHALVDDADYERLKDRHWQAQKKQDGRFYAVASVLGCHRDHRKYDKMHRFILGVTDASVRVDHIDGDGLNNQRQNLRLATPKQNGANRRVNVNSKFKGVSRAPTISERWQAYIKVDGRSRYLGRARAEVEAALLYDAAARKYFGAYAKPNFA